MPALGFSGPNLATLAYLQITGSTATADDCNSGVTVARTSGIAAGSYDITLPDNQGEAEADDLILTQVRNASSGVSVVTTDVDALTKRVACYSNATSTYADTDVTVLVLRTTVPPNS